MKNLSFDEVKSLISDARSAEEKRTLYIVLGVLATAIAVAVGVAIYFMKKECEYVEDGDMYDYWEDEEEYYDEDFEEEVSI